MTVYATCHPDRKHNAKGLCAQCYKNTKPRVKKAQTSKPHLSNDLIYYTRQKAIMNLGGKCTVCGLSDQRVLDIDHIDGNPDKEHRNLYWKLAALPDAWKKYQVLCANCHALKTRGYDYEYMGTHWLQYYE